MQRIAPYIKPFLLSILLLVLFVPMFQNGLHLLEKTYPLKGDVQLAGDVDFEKHNWFSAEYQEQKEKYLNDNFGFRELFVRLNNQIEYSLFSKAKANGVVIGKENYLYELNYIYDYTGINYIGDENVNKIGNQLKFISDTLHKLNKELIIVFAAGKASFYPEYIPSKFMPIKGISNYKAISTKINSLKITNIDFNYWFMKNRYKSKYPLYPQYGIHWSVYGATLAADSILKKIEETQKIDMPNLKFTTCEMHFPKDGDYDIADGMNLLFKLNTFNLAYPNSQTEDVKNKTKPKVLVIADSFYWTMYNHGISNSFKDSHFWYYNKQVFPETATNQVLANTLNMTTEINNHDVFIIMASETSIKDIGWGVINRIEQHFKGVDIVKQANQQSPEYKIKIKNFIKYIKEQPEWLIEVEERAKEKKISIDSALVLDAMWQIDNEKK